MRPTFIFLLGLSLYESGILTPGSVTVDAMCQAIYGDLISIPNTGYFILQSVTTRGYFVNHTEAADACQKCGLKLAQIKNMVTFAMVGRRLEAIVKKHKLQDTYYWVDNKYDSKANKYVFGSDGSVLEFSLFFHRWPRPIGIGSHIDYKGNYDPQKDIPQCLALSLPYPLPPRKDPYYKVTYGFTTTFDEVACESRKRRHALCETKVGPEAVLKARKLANIDENVENHTKAFMLTEDKLPYFESGNWIFGQRKFIVNWKHRTYDEAKEYCKKMELQVLDDLKLEDHIALIKYLKFFARELTAVQVWTSLKFKEDTQEFISKEGYAVRIREHVDNHGKLRSSIDGTSDMRRRSGKLDNKFCVARSWHYEFGKQMPCENPTAKDCINQLIRYIPCNCNNYHATICQHADNQERIINWEKSYENNITKALQETATTTFCSESNSNSFLRSTYKQTFGSLLCPEGFRMLRQNTSLTRVSTKEATTANVEYPYDWDNTYWVVDEQGFKKNFNSTCTVSIPDKDSRAMKKVRCDEWHFYICEKIVLQGKPFRSQLYQTDNPAMVWDIGPQERIYPILRSKHDLAALAGRGLKRMKSFKIRG